MNVIIVDDEPAGTKTLERLIANHFPAFRITGTANSLATALEEVRCKKCDILFLDVELGDGSGFDLLQKLEDRNFHVVFVTAHDSYAIEALRNHALDYLLKPVQTQEFLSAIERIQNNGTRENEEKVSVLDDSDKIVIPNADGFHFIDKQDVICASADGSYCRVHLQKGISLTVSKNLKDMEGLLNSDNFVRVHKSHLININCVTKYLKRDGGSLEMSDGRVIEISRRKKKEIQDLLMTLFQQR